MTISCSSIPESFVSIMGDPPIIQGEDNTTYMLLLEKLGGATAARNIIDWMMVKDVADLTWQVMRISEVDFRNFGQWPPGRIGCRNRSADQLASGIGA